MNISKIMGLLEEIEFQSDEITRRKINEIKKLLDPNEGKKLVIDNSEGEMIISK
jgi:hypothetical protein